MGKSDQHKKLVETSGEKTLDFLIGADPEGGYAKTLHTNSPYTMQASRVSIHLGVYRVKKKNFLSIFLAKLSNSKTLLFFTKKKYFLGRTQLSKNHKNCNFFGCRLRQWFSEVKK